MLGQWSSLGYSILNNMNRHYAASNKALLRISSGYRINSAADDPAGLAISEKMRAQIRGLNMAGKNIQDGIGLVQTAEGTLNETHAMIQRMRELAVQAASDTLTDKDRELINQEYQQLKEEITRSAQQTEFNTKKLLNGDHENTPIKIQAGANAGQTIDLYIGGMNSTSLGLDNSDILTRENADKAIGELDDALNKVSKERSRMGAYQNRMEHAYNNVMNTAENLTAAESRIRDADIAKEMMNFVKANILLQASQYIMRLHMQQAYSVLTLLDAGRR
ncbi:flagellin [Lysinibacillus louembei]|uniref:Flagellin n=1 Tax=Lysinibacillus louembei TaxID=1470088 RepID=A0ABZ0S438_9BACI|nr:flagellin [Lysinibacillus louembei]WPK13923.1 flagellin [Lysinibacillus louembei]